MCRWRSWRTDVLEVDGDDVTALILDGWDRAAFAPVAHLTVGGFRDWLLAPDTDAEVFTALAPGLTPEMVAAVSKIMRVQDLIAVARKVRVVTRFRSTIGLPGRIATRNQPNHPTDDSRGIALSALDGLLHGAGDAVIGVNPATDTLEDYIRICEVLEAIRTQLDIPTQHCCLGHVTTAIAAIEARAPVDLVFQSVAGSTKANDGFGVTLAMLDEAHDAVRALGRAPDGANLMYFETGQGAALSAEAHHGMDQQTMEARAYAVARRYDPLAGQHGRGLHRAGIPRRRKADHPRGAGGSFLRQAPRPADGGGHLLHEPLLRRSGGHGRPADRARRRRGQLRHHRARGRRHHAELPVAVLPRRAVHPRDAGPPARAGIRGAGWQTHGIGTPDASLPSLDAALGACACPPHEARPKNPRSATRSLAMTEARLTFGATGTRARHRPGAPLRPRPRPRAGGRDGGARC
jgi:ethanolamine ammonia-lyase large subunit